MSDTLYLSAEKNVEVHHPHVCLQDVVKLSCSNAKILNRLRVLPVLHLDAQKPGRYVLTVMDLIGEIQKKEENLEVTPLGETEFVVTFTKEKHLHKAWDVLKAWLVCHIAFFGTAFGIMTYNVDVNVKNLFTQIYRQFIGTESSGFSILEIAYSVGIGVGVLFFFNHFGRMKITSDPTPMQVKMRLYEDDVNQTIVEQLERKEGQKK